MIFKFINKFLILNTTRFPEKIKMKIAEILAIAKTE